MVLVMIVLVMVVAAESVSTHFDVCKEYGEDFFTDNTPLYTTF